MTRALVVLVAVTTITAIPAGVLADDIILPWWRDNSDPEGNRSTYQRWEFEINDTQPIADDYVNPPADLAELPPQAGIDPVGEWIDELNGRTGIWPLSGLMDMFIYNYSLGEEKKVWVQVTWTPQLQGAAPTVTVTPAFLPVPISGDLLIERPAGNGWMHSTYLILVQPNPEFEMVRIEGDINVDEVVIDTICPEPSTMLLLGAAVPFALKRRRRR